MNVASVLEFMQWHNEHGQAEMFRGQCQDKWSLWPTIIRYADLIKDEHKGVLDIEKHLIKQFEKYAMPFKDYRQASFLEKLVNAQHYGLPTRLLDWTSNPLKALYFAVNNPCHDHVDGIIYGLSPADWWEGTDHVNFESRLTIIYPESLNVRVEAQEGCFTSFPLPEVGYDILPLGKENYPDEIDFFCTVKILAQHKRVIRKELSKLGVNQRTIYPSLDGIARWIKSSLSNYQL